MSGLLHYVGEKPAIGSAVLITVNDVNRPTGVWHGRLVELGKDYDTTCECRATISDSVVDFSRRSWLDDEPSVNYTVYHGEAVITEMLRRRGETRKEIEALQQKLRIASQTYEAAIRALGCPPALAQLNGLIERIENLLSKKPT